MKKIFFSKILNYVVTTSALTFLMVRVILELRSALEKGTTIKDVTGAAASSSPASQTGGFGISGFISSVGNVGQEHTMPTLRNENALLPSTITSSKTCKECGKVLPIQAKFCSKCGNAQENRS
jgi:ribosomal protein L40E